MSNVIFMLSFIVNDTFKSLALLRLLLFIFLNETFLIILLSIISQYYLLFPGIDFRFFWHLFGITQILN